MKRGSCYRWQDQIRDEGGQRHEGKEKPATVHDAIGRKDRQRQQRHHPRGVHDRLGQLGEIEANPAHRRRDQQVEVLGQEEGGECGDDVRQQQDGEKRQQDHTQHLAGHEVADLIHAPEIAEHPEGNPEDGDPEEQGD